MLENAVTNVDVDRMVKRETESVLKEALTLMHAKSRSVFDYAIFGLSTYVANNWRAICCLVMTCTIKDERDSVANPITILVRSMYDAIIQAKYIGYDPSLATQRAADYRDFEIVEKYEHIARVKNGKCLLAQRILGSNLRATAEPELIREYQRVKSKYLIKGKKAMQRKLLSMSDGFMSGARAMLGAGLGMLVSDKMRSRRKGIALAMVAVGVAATVPIVMTLVRKKRRALPHHEDLHQQRSRRNSRSRSTAHSSSHKTSAKHN